MPKLVGLNMGEAKEALQAAIADSVETLPPNLKYVIVKWDERESRKPRGTILQVRAMGNLRDYQPDVEVTTSGLDPDARSRVEIRVILATPLIRFNGDSIYVDGAGSALITWLDGNLNIHQRTLSLPAWFRVPTGVNNFSAQRSLGDSGTIVCEIRFDDRTYARAKSSGPYAICSATGDA